MSIKCSSSRISHSASNSKPLSVRCTVQRSIELCLRSTLLSSQQKTHEAEIRVRERDGNPHKRDDSFCAYMSGDRVWL